MNSIISQDVAHMIKCQLQDNPKHSHQSKHSKHSTHEQLTSRPVR